MTNDCLSTLGAKLLAQSYLRFKNIYNQTLIFFEYIIHICIEKIYIRIMNILALLIMCNPVHPLNGSLPGPYVPARVTRGALVAHWYTYAPPRCRTLQYSRTFIPFSVSLWNDLASSDFDGVGLAGFKSRSNASLLA